MHCPYFVFERKFYAHTQEKNYTVTIWPVTGQGFQNTTEMAGSPILPVNFTKSKDSS